MLKDDADRGYWSNYLDHIGLFFIFTACAGISIIVWIFNWVCWLNNCCCCDFLHNPVNKRIAWWMSFSFLLGILACCISAFVSLNRFGFPVEGSWCAVDRMYYDSLNGQLKTSEPKWEGFKKLKEISKNLSKLFKFISRPNFNVTGELLPSSDFFFDSNEGLWKNSTEPIKNENQKRLLTRCSIIINSLIRLNNTKDYVESDLETLLDQDKFKNIKTTFLEKFYYYTRTLKACLKVLAMVYYCLFLIAITAAGVSMMFYACLKRQGYLLTFMHVLWNIIRFFMFSFFLYGTAYGIGFLAIRDSIAYVMYVFNQNLYENDPSKLINDGKDYFKICLGPNSNLKTTEIFDPIYITSLSDFFTNFNEIKKDKDSEDYFGIKSKIENLKNNLTNLSLSEEMRMNEKEFNDLVERAGREGGLFGSFDCGFLKSNLNLLYTALYDASVESRILSACSLCASFFGAVAIYFFLLVMHRYNNELFFDTGKSIFTGFDGFGGGYKKKSHNQDPAYKKRKLRAEIELTSKNDEQSQYNDVKKNEEEEE